MTYKHHRAALLSVALMLSAHVNTLEPATPNQRHDDYENGNPTTTLESKTESPLADATDVGP